MGNLLDAWTERQGVPGNIGYDNSFGYNGGPTVGPLVEPGVASTNPTDVIGDNKLRSNRPEDVDAFIRENYGQMAGFLDIPEIGRELRAAALAGEDYGRLYGRIIKTNWWQNTSAAQRTWQRLANEDPAEARRLVAETAANINNRARSLGLNLSASQIGGMATQATVNGWTDAQTIDSLMSQINWATLQAGDLTAYRDQIREIAGDYLVGVSAETAQNYAQSMASGEMSLQGVKSAMIKQAKGRFGYLASELDQGMTVKQYFEPVANRIEQELELGTGSVDMMDSKWLSMLEIQGEDGKPRAATLHEATQLARMDSRWANTQKAQESTTNMMSTIGKVFGRTAI